MHSWSRGCIDSPSAQCRDTPTDRIIGAINYLRVLFLVDGELPDRTSKQAVSTELGMGVLAMMIALVYQVNMARLVETSPDNSWFLALLGLFFWFYNPSGGTAHLCKDQKEKQDLITKTLFPRNQNPTASSQPARHSSMEPSYEATGNKPGDLHGIRRGSVLWVATASPIRTNHANLGK
ncbi:hypothetical protein F5Y19DRAFT_232358 [Xylariaceae sp. FL1651]|nr:hypothetical protein F5Y19DRAFT_232358 [Xylariaceae sp. FL1651]